jgi:hypothetical protein
VRLQNYSDRLKRTGILTIQQIDRKLEAVRKQRVTSLFYLPQGDKLDSDYIALLDDLHNLPIESFQREATKSKLFTLGQMGFYLFLLKLSIHCNHPA